MSLAAMLAADKDAVICDLAETYGIFDYKALPVNMLAVLVLGLRENSRIKTKMHGYERREIPLDVLMAKCVDYLALLLYVWAHGKNDALPEMMIDYMFNGGDEEKGGFETFEEYEAARQRFFKD